MTPAERYFYDRGRYGEIAGKIDIAMAHTDKPCVGGECDEGFRCERHARTEDVVERYVRAKKAMKGAE